MPSPAPSIAAILWDFGGVITSSPFDAFARYERERGLPSDFIRSVNSRDPNTNAWARFERSEIDREAFSEAFRSEALALGHDVPGADVLALLEGDIRPEMAAALEYLAGRYKVACLTNNVRTGHGPAMSRDAGRAAAVARIMGLFNVVVESSRVGVRKPEQRFYEIALQALQVDAANAVYLDDLGINLKPARALGMHTIKVVSAVQALADLESVLGHPLPTAA